MTTTTTITIITSTTPLDVFVVDEPSVEEWILWMSSRRRPISVVESAS